MMRFGLKEETIAKICSVFEKFPQVEKVILYGSRAMGNYKNGSDIDITLIGGDDLTLQVLFKIIDEIDDLMLPYSFDISLYKHINDKDVIDHIQRVGQIFYTKQSATV